MPEARTLDAGRAGATLRASARHLALAPAGRVRRALLRTLVPRTEGCARRRFGLEARGTRRRGFSPALSSPPTFFVPGVQELLNGCAMRHELTAETLARRILWGLDQAMAGRPRPLRLRSAPSPTAPLVALIDYVSGFPCLWVTPFAFYGEKTATLLQALDRCLPSGKLDEVECCLLHAPEPGRSLVFDWLVDLGFTHSEDGHWLVWRSRRLEGDRP